MLKKCKYANFSLIKLRYSIFSSISHNYSFDFIRSWKKKNEVPQKRRWPTLSVILYFIYLTLYAWIQKILEWLGMEKDEKKYI